MKFITRVLACSLLLLALPTAQAAFLIEVDVDGLDDGVLTFSPNFGFGGDTTTASQSSPSSAVGMSGGDSIFGGNGVNSPDTYLFSYTPGVDGDNLPLAAGTALNTTGSVATGLAAGGAGPYNVYATWPLSNNISGDPVTFTLSDGVGDLFSVTLTTNDTGNEWFYLGTALLDPATTYTLSQEAGSNTFVSMRAAGVLFDAAVPEPTSLALASLVVCGVAVAARRRR
jgi:hypothetical protein